MGSNIHHKLLQTWPSSASTLLTKERPSIMIKILREAKNLIISFLHKIYIQVTLNKNFLTFDRQ